MTRQAQTHQDAIRSIERLHRILEAAKLLNSTLDLAELTAIILKLVREEVGIDRGTVFVLDRRRRLLRSLVAQDVKGHEIVVPLERGIAGTVGASGDTINIPDAYADSRFDSSFDAKLGYRTRDIYCMPIVNRMGDIVGVLELLNRTRALTVEDEEFLAGVSVHVGLALENARMHREIVEKRKMKNVRGEEFGMDRLIDLVSRERSASARNIHTTIRSVLQQFVGDEPTHDDSTLIVLKFN